MSDIMIEKSILHILDPNAGVPVLSARSLPQDESEEFFIKHIQRLWKDSDLKECEFDESDNPVRDAIDQSSGEYFVAFTQKLSEVLFSIMSANVDIPPADVYFTVFRKDQSRFLGILKLNYKEAYTHSLVNMENDSCTGIIKYRALFPGEAQKIDECVFIDLASKKIWIKERKYEIDGQKEYYLSKLLLKTRPARSYKEQYKLVEKSAEQVVKKYYSDDSLKHAEVKMAIKNNVDENLEIDVEKLSKAAFSDSQDMQRQYREELSQKGFTEKKIKINQQIYEDLEKNHKLITDIGIKMEIPSSLIKDPSKVEFIVNQDGTMSILIKNVNEVKSR